VIVREQKYFETIHLSLPILHQSRFTMATISEPRVRPPAYLRYIVCALGALTDPTQSSFHGPLYRASRRQIEDIDYTDPSTTSMNLARPQTWTLIAIYELLQMEFHRFWSSAARAVRLVQIMGLYIIDGNTTPRRPHPVVREWSDLEEQRRTFWMAFCLDRYICFNNGCPVIIDMKDVSCKIQPVRNLRTNC
jgi:hypothetical protein